ncbi:MAG: histidine kinase [Thermoleophilia bacterium]
MYLKEPTSGGQLLSACVGAAVPAVVPPPSATPIRLGEETVGSLVLTGPHGATPAELTGIAIALGLALRAGQLFEALQGRARDLDREVRLLMGLQEIAAAVTRAGTPRDVAEVVASHARRLVRGTAAAVVDRHRVVGQEGHPRPVAITAAMAAIASGHPQRLPGPVLALPIPAKDPEATQVALVVSLDGGEVGDEDADRLASLAQQAAIAFTNARLVADLRAEQEHRARTSAALVHAQEQERQRIAEDIHDGPIQELVALGLLLDALGQELARDGVAAGREVAQASGSAREAVGRLREAIFDLHPMSLRQLGFAAAVRVVLSRASARGADAEMGDLAAADRLDHAGRTVAFRIVQEAVANAVTHAAAAHIAVSAGLDADTVWVEVRDDGRGFDVERTRTDVAGGHLGLDALRERASLAGAELVVSSRPGSGTAVRARFPVPSQPD